MGKDTLTLLSKSVFVLSLSSLLLFLLHPLPSRSPLLPSPSMDSSLLSNIQKLFYEKIEVFSKVEFSKLSITTGIVKIFLKVSTQTASLEVEGQRSKLDQ